MAASFPDGSISPYSRSSIVIQASSSRLAVVPGTTEAHLVTLKYVLFRPMLYFLQIYRVQIAVMTLVIEAISLFCPDLKPN